MLRNHVSPPPPPPPSSVGRRSPFNFPMVFIAGRGKLCTRSSWWHTMSVSDILSPKTQHHLLVAPYVDLTLLLLRCTCQSPPHPSDRTSEREREREIVIHTNNQFDFDRWLLRTFTDWNFGRGQKNAEQNDTCPSCRSKIRANTRTNKNRHACSFVSSSCL